MSGLKPCPFCGSKAKYYMDDMDYNHHEVSCSNTECTYLISEKKTKGAAYAAWNQRQDGWISVDDRLPKKGERVLIFTSDVIEAVMYEQKRFNRFGRGIDYATHWQPLPHPPTTSTPPTHGDDLEV